jgi:hypothetical protein
MPETIRLLISGSRGFTWPRHVWDTLDAERARLRPGDTLIVVHGDCGDGDPSGGVDAFGRL